MKLDTGRHDARGTENTEGLCAWRPAEGEGGSMVVDAATDRREEQGVMDKLDRMADELRALGIQF